MTYGADGLRQQFSHFQNGWRQLIGSIGVLFVKFEVLDEDFPDFIVREVIF